MTEFTDTAHIGDSSIEIVTEGPEDEAEKLHLDLKARLSELNQMIDGGEHPDEASAVFSIDWEDYLGYADEE